PGQYEGYLHGRPACIHVWLLYLQASPRGESGRGEVERPPQVRDGAGPDAGPARSFRAHPDWALIWRLSYSHPVSTCPRPALDIPAHRQPALVLDETGDLGDAPARTQIGEDERPRAAHALGVPFHDLERGPDMRSEVNLVDHQEVGAGDTGTAL